MLRNGDLYPGGITGTLLRFTPPMMAGSLLQQCYNIADTLIVGQCIGADALAAVGSAYTLMVFLISILLGLSIGSGTVFSLHYGAGKPFRLAPQHFRVVRTDRGGYMRAEYGGIRMAGPYSPFAASAAGHLRHDARLPVDNLFVALLFTFIYNFYAAMLRAVGDSVTPLWFLELSVG